MIEKTKNKPKEILKLKSVKIKIHKESKIGLNRQKKWSVNFKDRAMETAEAKEQKENRLKKSEQSLRSLWDASSRQHTHYRSSRRRREEIRDNYGLPALYIKCSSSLFFIVETAKKKKMTF